MSSETDIAHEAEAVERLKCAIATIADDMHWYWQWGDGEGGFILSLLKEAAHNKGYRFPGDRTWPENMKRKAKIKQSLRTQVFERDEYRCVTCGSHKDLACDHIFPESLGGEATLENLQTLCKVCNSRKGKRVWR